MERRGPPSARRAASVLGERRGGIEGSSAEKERRSGGEKSPGGVRKKRPTFSPSGCRPLCSPPSSPSLLLIPLLLLSDARCARRGPHAPLRPPAPLLPLPRPVQVCLSGVQILSAAIESAGEGFAAYTEEVLPPLTERLGDSKEAVRLPQARQGIQRPTRRAVLQLTSFPHPPPNPVVLGAGCGDSDAAAAHGKGDNAAACL